MKVTDPAQIRNVAVAGHNDTGKTSLCSALLYTGGAVNRFNRVEDGHTVTDFDPEEIQRGISIGLAPCYVGWKQTKINLLDCPGYGIFFSETLSGLRAADLALLCVDAVSGVEVTTEKAWEAAAEMELPAWIHLTKMDRERADFAQRLAEMREQFGRSVTPLQVPIGQEDSFRGVVDLLSGRAWTFERDGYGKGRQEDPPADLAERVE